MGEVFFSEEGQTEELGDVAQPDRKDLREVVGMIAVSPPETDTGEASAVEDSGSDSE